MKSSAFFERSTRFGQTIDAAQYFESKAHLIYATDPEQSWIDVHVRLADDEETATKTNCDDSEVTENDVKHGVAEMRGPFRGLTIQKLHDVGEVWPYTNQAHKISTFFFIRQRNSYSRLSISRKLFDFILEQCQVFHQFKSFISCFGTRTGENEVGPPHLRFRYLYQEQSRESAQAFECAYVLRFVELNHRSESRPWSVRQFAVYHKYFSLTCLSTWIFLAISQKAQDCLDSYLSHCGDVTKYNPFEIHVLLLNIAMANWRPYLVHVTSETNDQADRVMMADVDSEAPIRVTEIEEQQRLKQLEDKILDLDIIFESTLDTINSLLANYDTYSRWPVNNGETPGADPDDAVISTLQEQRRDVLLYLAKVHTLKSKVQGYSQMVSSLLDLDIGHSLKTLAEEARLENTTMRQLTEKATSDAAAVKVLTIMTLVYLPATVVSNFFSTSFVHQVAQPDQSLLLRVTANWWIFLAASIPLTIVTLYIWWFYVQHQITGHYPAWWRIIASVCGRLFGRLYVLLRDFTWGKRERLKTSRAEMAHI